MLLKRNNLSWIWLAFSLVLFPVVFIERFWKFKVIILVGTGRVGSKSFASAFGTQKNILAAHEPHWDFNRLSIAMANANRGLEKPINGFKYLIRLFRIRQLLICRFGNYNYYIESNNRLSYIIHSWSEAFPKTEVYMLHRNRNEVIQSALKRKHYSDDDPYKRLYPRFSLEWTALNREGKIDYWFSETNRIISEYPFHSIVGFPFVVNSSDEFINSFKASIKPKVLREIYSAFPWENRN